MKVYFLLLQSLMKSGQLCRAAVFGVLSRFDLGASSGLLRPFVPLVMRMSHKQFTDRGFTHAVTALACRWHMVLLLTVY